MTTLVRALRLSTAQLFHPYETTKRALDVAFGVVGLGSLLVLFAPIAIAIRLDSRGPVLYRQRRVGRNGQVFDLLKFRSMYADAERGGPRWARRDDARVTRVGRLLRRSHLDELPQAINLLCGEMSMVGPRPERPEFLARLTALDPRHDLRHAVRPGLAGLAYLRQGYAASYEEALERLRHDLEYLERRSLGYDLQILFASLLKALTCGGR